MNEPEKIKLEIEASVGDQKKALYEEHVLPFIEMKTAQLFNAFESIDANNIQELQKIKLQQTALRALEADFVSYINTGKLAKKQLEKMQ